MVAGHPSFNQLHAVDAQKQNPKQLIDNIQCNMLTYNQLQIRSSLLTPLSTIHQLNALASRIYFKRDNSAHLK